MRFPVKNFKELNVDFNIYTIGMELVYKSEETLKFFPEVDQYVVKWNVRDNKNKKLSSGVYIYVIKSGDDIIKGKLVIFNE